MVTSEKDAENIQVIQKYLKLAKSARTATDNSTFLQSDFFEINTDKSQVNESVLFAQLREKKSFIV